MYEKYARAFEFIARRTSADRDGILMFRLARRVQGLRVRCKSSVALALHDVACKLPLRSRPHFQRTMKRRSAGLAASGQAVGGARSSAR
jgi:hypothetical protein